MQKMMIVGDRFSAFALDKEAVLTISEFSSLVWAGGVTSEALVTLGQGVDYDRLMGIADLSKRRHGIEIAFSNLEILVDQRDTEHCSKVHKHRRENVMVSRPVARDENTYTAWLMVQDEGELLNDHMTGQHVQGIVLTEAGRQMLLVTSEYFLLDEEAKGKSYFVLNTLSSTYSRFAFPLPTQIEFRILSMSRKKGLSLRAASETNFYQDRELVATVQSEFVAYPASYIGAKEAELAIKACEKGPWMIPDLTRFTVPPVPQPGANANRPAMIA
jgi:hypothetical protein